MDENEKTMTKFVVHCPVNMSVGEHIAGSELCYWAHYWAPIKMSHSDVNTTDQPFYVPF